MMIPVAVAALLMSLAVPAAAQAPRIGYVNSDIILRDLPEAKKAQEELEQVVKGWQDELQRMSQELQKGLEEYQQKQALYNPEKKQQEEARLTGLQQRVRDYQLQKFDSRQGEIVELQEKKLGPVKKTILEAIEAVAKEDGFSFVFDKANDVLLLFADSKFDLTYRVMDRLKRGPTPGKTK
jgi:outer membrane protein